MQKQNIIIKHIVTEKSNLLAEKNSQYSFYVAKNADKLQIKKAITHRYAVDIIDISTLRLGGGKKNKKYTNKGVFYVNRPIQKKAIVTLKKGQVIDFAQDAE